MKIRVEKIDEITGEATISLDVGVADKKITREFILKNTREINFRQIRKHIQTELVKEKTIKKDLSELKVSEKDLTRGSIPQ